MAKKIDFAEAHRLLTEEKDCVLMDVRDEVEYNTGHAYDAVLLPVDDIAVETAEALAPDKDAPVLVYCKTGMRSRMAALKLEVLGYKRVYDIGSLSGWPYGLEI